MAQRRMFSNKVIDTDIFLDLPISTQLLYFHLAMRADDDGFISAPRKIMRIVGCSDEEMKFLIMKSFVIPFESGVCVIKHWRIHNYIRSDRYNETIYKHEKSMLTSENGIYELSENNNEKLNVIEDMPYQRDTQDSLGKVKLGKDSGDKSNISEKENSDIKPSAVSSIMEQWNKLNLSKIIKIKNDRLKKLNARVKEYSIEDVLKAIKSIENSSFLKGNNDRNWVITFDWLLKPNNFIKVLEGNYVDKKVVSNGTSYDFTGNENTENDRKQDEEEELNI